MTEAEVRELIRQVMGEWLTRQRAKRVMVLWSGAMLGCVDAAISLSRLTALGIQLDFVQTPSSKRLHSPEKIAAIGMREASGHFVADHDLLVLPTLTANLTAKVAHGIADCLGSNVVADFLQSGKPVIASRTGADPLGPAKRSIYPQMPPAYAAVLAANLATLAAMGVVLAEADQLDNAVLACSMGGGDSCCELPSGGVVVAGASAKTAAKLISQAEVAGLKAGTTLTIPRSAVITPQARDYARTHQIRLERQA